MLLNSRIKASVQENSFRARSRSLALGQPAIIAGASHASALTRHLNFLSRSTSSMVLELSSGAFSPKISDIRYQISSYCRLIWTFSAHFNFLSRLESSMVLELSFGASSLKKQGNTHCWLKNVRYQAIEYMFGHFQHI